MFHKTSELKIAFGKVQAITSRQIETLEKMQILIKNLTWPGKSKKSMLPFQHGILCGTNATIQLLKDIQEEGFKYILTRRMNQVKISLLKYYNNQIINVQYHHI